MNDKMRNIRFFLSVAFAILLISGCGQNPLGSDLEDLLPISEVRPLEEDMFDMLNSDRADSGLYPLLHNEDLRDVARDHSEDMYLRDFFSHTNPDGDSPADRADFAGIDYIAIGENIAMNTYDNPVESAQEALMDSPGYRANILSVEYNNVGVGIASDGETYYFTQLFADLSIPTYKSITTIIFEPAEERWPDRLETFNEVWNR